MAEEFNQNDSEKQELNIRRLEFAAELGDAVAQYGLGLYYAAEKNDYAKAVHWYQKAAEQGNAEAQHILGRCYAAGAGVAQDHAKAASWFQKAAEQGNAEAQCSLGICYGTGEGVTADVAKAAHWFEKAAEQGNAGVQYMLSKCYQNGIGVAADNKKAEEWLEKAAAQGDEDAKKELESLREDRKKQELARQQAAEEERRSREAQKNADINAAIYMLLGAIVAAFLFTKGTPLYNWTIEHRKEIFFLLKPLLQLAAIVLSALGGAAAVGLLLGAIVPSLAIVGALAGGVGGLISIFCYEDPNVYQVAKNVAFVVMALAAVLLVIQLIRKLARAGK